jgi:hypothetical protein
MGLELSNKTIEKYFKFLSHMDNASKKRLIIKLTNSIDEKNKSDVSLRNLYGAWDDSRSSDEIIKDIRNSRINKDNDLQF